MSGHIREITRVMLVSPLPPPQGGIGTWTKIFLQEILKFPKIRIQHLDSAQRRKNGDVYQSTLSRVAYGTMFAVVDILRAIPKLAVFRPHVLHVTSSAGFASIKDLILFLFAKLFGVAGVIHYHTSLLACQDVSGWQFRVARLAMGLATGVVVIDPLTYSVLRKYLPSTKLYKIPNMIDLDRIDRIQNERQQGVKKEIPTETRIFFAGRVTREKGVVELVEACCQLSEIDLSLIGRVDESFRAQLEQLAQRRERGKWLHFLGQVENDDACRHMLSSDIILLPSYFEGFPLVVLEGMALGKPVVASDVGAIAEMIDVQGKSPCGMCVPPKDTAALQGVLQLLLGQREKWEEMGQQGRKRVESLYSTTSVMEQLEALWVEVGRSHKSQKDKLRDTSTVLG
jgi:glycosyltransferase involved in cell wall biosynthesis